MKTRNFAHRCELAFSGFSGVGKTTLLVKLIEVLSKKFDVGYIKHDAHHFEMDYPGKDTYLAKKANAKEVFINNSSSYALQGQGEFNKFLLPFQFVDCDFVFIEGHKKSEIPKIIFLDEKGIAPVEKDPSIIGVVGQSSSPSKSWNDLPYFHRDEIEKIQTFIVNYFEKRMKILPLKGLILTGGKSSRMGKDKFSLSYKSNTNQSEILFNLLSKVCSNVYFSCREDQKNLPILKDFPQIHDLYHEMGPTGGILSAMAMDPDAFWFVLACDLPFISEEGITYLAKKRDHFKVATTFYNEVKKWPAPLCTIYSPKSHLKFKQFWGAGYLCPRKVLFNSSIKIIHFNEKMNSNFLNNANTHEEYLQARKILGDV